MGEAKLPVYAANLRDVNGATLPAFKDRTLLDFDGVRIGLTGLAYEQSPRVSSPDDLRFGSTIAIRRQALQEIGGFLAFRDSLADDFEIGRALRSCGYRLAYPPLLVSHRCTEARFCELWAHELRWARTIRSIDPLGHWGSSLTYALPWGLLAAAFLAFSPASLVVLATVIAARLFLKARIDHIAGVRTGPAWLLPVRDVLSFGVFLASLAGRGVDWRGERLRIGARGAIS